MIITRTPFRVSFVGGGSDLKDFYSRNGYGAVISAAIKRYMYIVIHPYFQDKIRIKYSKTEDVGGIEEVQHPIVRECLRKVQVEKGVEIASFADVSSGTGLGSSGAFTVGLLNALYTYKGQVISKERLAREACEIEIEILGEPIGKQDQYSSAYGGINYIRFNKDESVEVRSFLLSENARKELESHLSLYYIGGDRNARDILCEQRDNMSDALKLDKLQQMLKLVEELKEAFLRQEVGSLADILHKGWSYKKALASGISNRGIDNLYDKFMQHGALGGKLLGAGGNGFLLIYADDHSLFKKDFGSKTLAFNIDNEGTKILFREP